MPFYEDSPALLIPPDLVMPPAGKGPLSDGPLHPGLTPVK